MAKTEARRLLVSYGAANTEATTNAVARDATLGGLFIETPNPLPLGALLSVEVKGTGLSVTLEGRVFKCSSRAEGPDRPAGMGVRFLDLPADVLGKLQLLLDHHRPPARTRLGVGDEREALWNAAGGRDDLAIAPVSDESARAFASTVHVEGRPTPDVPAPVVASAPPPAPAVAPAPPTSSWSAPPAPTITNRPAAVSAPVARLPPQNRTLILAMIVGVVVLVVLAAVWLGGLLS